MEAKAKLSYARISSRKVKIVLDMIRNKDVATALGILKNTPKAASEILEKLLNSAIANAVTNHEMDIEKLYREYFTPVYRYAQENQTQSTGTGIQNQKKNQPHYLGVKGKRIIRKGRLSYGPES